MRGPCDREALFVLHKNNFINYEVDFSRNEATGFSNPTGDTCVGPGMVSTQYYF